MSNTHRIISPKRIPWLRYCAKCGHIPLANGVSALVSRLGCDYESHPLFLAWVAGGRKPLP